MIVLDTNILSELMRPEPNPRVIDWLDNQDTACVAISAITVAEVLYGIERLANGKRKRTFAAIAGGMFDEEFAGRILPFDAEAAVYYAEQVATSERAGRRVSMADAQIAAICLQHGATLATRNVKGFAAMAVQVVDPWVAT